MHANDYPLTEPESWWHLAACAGYGPDMFFPATTDKIAAALAVHDTPPHPALPSRAA